MQSILMTGAAGGIGTRMRSLLKNVYPRLRLSDISAPRDLKSDEEFVAADLADMAAVEKTVAGVEGIIHLGGFSGEGPWETIHSANIVGCYNLFEAARRAKVKRVVFASSNHAVGFYPRTRRIGADHRVRPDSRYGVSKAFGEALGSLYASKHGMRVTSIRIGNFGRCAGRSATALDLDIAAGSGTAHPHRPRAPRHPLRDLLRRLRQRARLVGQCGCVPLRLPADRPQ